MVGITQAMNQRPNSQMEPTRSMSCAMISLKRAAHLARCRTPDIENLFVVDASFFPSSAAVNPGLTIVAQALRVADHIRASHL